MKEVVVETVIDLLEGDEGFEGVSFSGRNKKNQLTFKGNCNGEEKNMTLCFQNEIEYDEDDMGEIVIRNYELTITGQPKESVLRFGIPVYKNMDYGEVV